MPVLRRGSVELDEKRVAVQLQLQLQPLPCTQTLNPNPCVQSELALLHLGEIPVHSGLPSSLRAPQVATAVPPQAYDFFLRRQLTLLEDSLGCGQPCPMRPSSTVKPLPYTLTLNPSNWQDLHGRAGRSVV